MAIPTPEFQAQIDKRIGIVIDAMRFSCGDCNKALCHKHEQLASDLCANPRRLLAKLEREYSALGHE